MNTDDEIDFRCELADEADFDYLWEKYIRDSDRITNAIEDYTHSYKWTFKGKKTDAEIEAMAEEQAEEDAYDKYDEIVDIINSIRDDDLLYREICDNDPRKLLSEISKGMRVGVYWAMDMDHAISYWGSNLNKGVVLAARIKKRFIDVKNTIIAYIDNEDEDEIRVKEGSDLYIVDAIIREGCGEISNKKEIERVYVGKVVKA